MTNSTSSESIKSNVELPIDFKNVPILPDSHTWSTNPSPVDHPFTFQVPIIDLSKPDAAKLVGQACEEWGMFQVTNHGIPNTLLNETDSQARSLFGLPQEQKLLIARSPGSLTGYGQARISPFFPKLMWYEGFTMVGSPAEHAAQLWPGHDVDQTKFCNVMEECQKKMKDLSDKVISLILSSLGLTEEEATWVEPENGCTGTQGVLQLNSYPVCPDPDRAMGLAPHTDSSLLTLLYQGNVSGLQIFRDGAGWMTVHPMDGALVVNVGDLLHIISNGRFKTVLHRSAVNNTNHRISIAYFSLPPGDAKVSPAMKLIDRDHPPLYRPVTWEEYIGAKAIHFDKALELIRLNVDAIPITKLGLGVKTT